MRGKLQSIFSQGEIFPALLLALVLLSLANIGHPMAAEKPERHKVNARQYPWSAVGRVNIRGVGHCSGVLVAPRIVLTAAHCLFDARRNRWVSAADVHFLAAYEFERYDFHSPVKRYVYDRRFRLEKKITPKTVAADWSFLVLKKPLGHRVGTIGFRLPTGADVRQYRNGAAKFIHLGYRGRRSHVLTGYFQCPVLGILRDLPLLAHGCVGEKGESGGPLLKFTRTRLQVVGLQSMIAPTKQYGKLSFATFGVRRFPEHAKRPILRFIQANKLLRREGQPPDRKGKITALPHQMLEVYLRKRGWLRADAGYNRDRATAAVIRAVQKKHRLPITGAADLNLLAVLMGVR